MLMSKCMHIEQDLTMAENLSAASRAERADLGLCLSLRVEKSSLQSKVSTSSAALFVSPSAKIFSRHANNCEIKQPYLLLASFAASSFSTFS